jgi:hypothetical protein
MCQKFRSLALDWLNPKFFAVIAIECRTFPFIIRSRRTKCVECQIDLDISTDSEMIVNQLLFPIGYFRKNGLIDPRIWSAIQWIGQIGCTQLYNLGLRYPDYNPAQRGHGRTLHCVKASIF